MKRDLQERPTRVTYIYAKRDLTQNPRNEVLIRKKICKIDRQKRPIHTRKETNK